MFVDVLRIIASLQMISGHTLDSLLLPAWEQGPVFAKYTWFRGLTSVAFLLVAGVAYYLATIRRFEAHKASPGGSARRFRRGVDLILISYALRVPWTMLTHNMEATSRHMDWFLTCGVLQCIGVTLLALEAMTWLARRPNQVVVGASVLAVALVVAAPVLDTITPTGPSRVLLNYVTHRGGSSFPLAPWAAYMLGGVGLGAFVLPQGADTPMWSRLTRLGLLAAGCWAAYYGLKPLDLPFVTDATTYSARPVAIFDRLSGILVMLAGLAVVCQPIKRLPPLFAILSGETLALYVIHLILLYHPPFILAARVGRSSLELGPALAMSATMIVSTVLPSDENGSASRWCSL